MSPPRSAGIFSVDGTQVQAWVSMKSFRAKDGSDDPPGPGRNGERSFHGEKRNNQTHCLDDRPAGAAASQGRGQEAFVSGPCADGEPQRT
jgi:hypothetical protein